MVFDNTKIKRLVPGFEATIAYCEAARAQIAWYDQDPRRQAVDDVMNAKIDRILAAYARAWPSHEK